MNLYHNMKDAQEYTRFSAKAKPIVVRTRRNQGSGLEFHYNQDEGSSTDRYAKQQAGPNENTQRVQTLHDLWLVFSTIWEKVFGASSRDKTTSDSARVEKMLKRIKD